MTRYLELEFCTLLDTGRVRLTNEHDLIDLTQRLRRNCYDMERVSIDFDTYLIEIACS
jgi:hypothetical protein